MKSQNNYFRFNKLLLARFVLRSLLKMESSVRYRESVITTKALWAEAVWKVITSYAPGMGGNFIERPVMPSLRLRFPVCLDMR